jgi:hypothetical protein
MTQEQYHQAWADFQAGRLSLTEWQKVAREMLDQKLSENADVLKRLADR